MLKGIRELLILERGRERVRDFLIGQPASLGSLRNRTAE